MSIRLLLARFYASSFEHCPIYSSDHNNNYSEVISERCGRAGFAMDTISNLSKSQSSQKVRGQASFSPTGNV